MELGEKSFVALRKSYEPGKDQVSGGKTVLGTFFSLHRLSVGKSHQAAAWKGSVNHPSEAALLGASWVYPPFSEDGGDKLKVVSAFLALYISGVILSWFVESGESREK